MDNLKTELLNNPSTETVRQVRIMLNDVQKKLKGLPTSSVKAILDAIYNFIPFIKVKKQPAGEYKNDPNNYSQAKDKSSEVRRSIRDMLIKFTHDNSIRYLGADIYPESYEEAKKYFDIENKEKNVKDELHDYREAKLNQKEAIKRKGEADQVAYETKQEASRVAREDAKRRAEEKRDALVQVYNYLFDPANFEVLKDADLNRRSALATLQRYGEDTTNYEALNDEADYNKTLGDNIQNKVKALSKPDAVQNVLTEINTTLSGANRRSAKNYLIANKNDPSRVLNYLGKTRIPPDNIRELISILKVASDPSLVQEVIGNINTA
jgi:predicted transcriptional regulator with HTH domain